jgi:hypothetical protein
MRFISSANLRLVESAGYTRPTNGELSASPREHDHGFIKRKPTVQYGLQNVVDHSNMAMSDWNDMDALDAAHSSYVKARPGLKMVDKRLFQSRSRWQKNKRVDV